MRPNLEAFQVPQHFKHCRAYLALALARLGNRDHAEQLSAETRDWMEAWRETERMETLERELGRV